MNQEVVLLSEGDVLVSSARFVSGGVTYALANITSVQGLTEPKESGPLVMGLIAVPAGVLVMIAGGFSPVGVFGICVAAVGVGGIVKWLVAKPGYVVVVRSSGVETHALRTANPDQAHRVVTALNNAIVTRR